MNKLDNVLKERMDLLNRGEIDIYSIVNTFCREKYLVLIITVFFLFVGCGYAFNAQQWWTSSAIIRPVDNYNLSDVNIKLSNVFASSRIKVEESEKVNDVKAEIKKILKSENIFNVFVSEFSSDVNKKEFLKLNDISSSNGSLNALNDEANRIKINRLNPTVDDEYITNFQSKGQSNSYDMLLAYHNFINKIVVLETINKIESVINTEIKLLISERDLLLVLTQEKIKIELKRTKLAYEIAIAAKLDKPMQQMTNDKLFPIDMGSEALLKKQQIIEKTNDYDLFEPKLSTISLKLNMLNNTNLKELKGFQTVKFIKNIEKPIYRDSPNRKVIILFSLALGLFVSAIVITLKEIYVFNKTKLTVDE